MVARSVVVAILIFVSTAAVARHGLDIGDEATAVDGGAQGVTVVEGPAWAYDGQTVDVDHQRIRLQGLDAPALIRDLDPDTPFVPSPPAAVEAFYALNWLVVQETQSWLRCVVLTQPDAGGILTGSCRTMKGRDIAQEMIRQGKALGRDAERAAHEDHRIIWAGDERHLQSRQVLSRP